MSYLFNKKTASNKSDSKAGDKTIEKNAHKKVHKTKMNVILELLYFILQKSVIFLRVLKMHEVSLQREKSIFYFMYLKNDMKETSKRINLYILFL